MSRLNPFLPALALGTLVACAGTPLPDQTPVAVAPVKMSGNEWRVIDQVFVVTDASGSTYMEKSFPEAKALSRSFIQSLPDKNQRAKDSTYQVSAIGFGGDDRKTAPLAPFDRAALERTAADYQLMGSIDGRGGETPFEDVFAEIALALEGQRGKAAVVVFSDGVPTHPIEALAAAQLLADSHPDGVCFHAVQVGNDPAGSEWMNALASVTNCGSVRPAENLQTASAISAFTSGVVTGTAPPPPSVAAAAPCQGVMRLRGVEFAFDSAKISDSSQVVLDVAADELRRCPNLSINVNGYTDSIGTEAYNLGLSERRATAVQKFLESKGIGGAQLEPHGMGESSPVAPNDTADGRARNRRVELVPR